MLFSAIQILIFHLWVFVWQNNVIESFIKQTAYIGVDTFFFISAYSLGKKEGKYDLRFLYNRFVNIYIKFIVFALVACIYAKWKFSYFIEVISSINLFKHGGGAFLWFLPALMLFYILFCIFKKGDRFNAKLTFLITIVVWICVTVLINIFVLYRISIFWNRIPIFLFGYYIAKYKLFDKLNNKLKFIIGIIFISIGIVSIYNFCYISKLQTPFRDAFYLVSIIEVIGIVLLLDLVPNNKIINILGSCTLEMYAIQMIFGYNFTNTMIKLVDSKLLINICTMLFVIILSVIVHYPLCWILEKLNNNSRN